MAGAPNPPQSRAPARGPTAQGATSDLASRRLQIRSALSPPAGSGDPPPLPSAPAPLRAAAPLWEGREPPRSSSRGQPAPAPGPHRPPPTPTPCPLLGEPPLRSDPGAEESRSRRGALQPDAAACAPSARARSGGCQAPRAPESAAWSLRVFAPQTKAHFAQSGQGAVPTGGGLTTPYWVPRPPKISYPEANPVSFERPNTRRPGPSVPSPGATTPNPASPASRPLPPKNPFPRLHLPLNPPLPEHLPRLPSVPYS